MQKKWGFLALELARSEVKKYTEVDSKSSRAVGQPTLAGFKPYRTGMAPPKRQAFKALPRALYWGKI